MLVVALLERVPDASFAKGVSELADVLADWLDEAEREMDEMDAEEAEATLAVVIALMTAEVGACVSVSSASLSDAGDNVATTEAELSTGADEEEGRK